MKDWTIMVYMAGDNNLSDDMITALKEMRKSFTGLKEDPNIAVLAYFDSGAISYPTVYIDFTPTDYEPEPEHIQQVPATPLGKAIPKKKEESNLTSIEEFVSWCVTEDEIEPGIKGCGYKAHNYALIFSGHGDGFQPATFLSDSNPSSSMSVAGLGKTLMKIKRKYLDNKKLGILGFDSCVMGTVEVACEMHKTAEYMVSSQGFIPNVGWNYDFLRTLLHQNTFAKITNSDPTTPEKLAQLIARRFSNGNVDHALYGGRSIDISVCNLNKMSNIGKRINELGATMKNAVLEEIKEFQDREDKDEQAINFEFIANAILLSHQNAQTYLCDQSVDIKDFTDLLLENCTKNLKILNSTVDKENYSLIVDHFGKIVKAAESLQKTLENALQCVYLGAEFQYSNGLSLFFPWSYFSFHMTKRRYLNFNFAQSKVKKGKISKKEKPEIQPAVVVVPSEENDTIPESGWTDFLTHYLWATLRDVRMDGNLNIQQQQYILGMKEPELEKLTNSQKHRMEINPMLNKLNPPRDTKLNPPRDSRLNPPRDSRLISSFYSDLENFSRTRNAPWGARYWEYKETASLMDHFLDEIE